MKRTMASGRADSIVREGPMEPDETSKAEEERRDSSPEDVRSQSKEL